MITNTLLTLTGEVLINRALQMDLDSALLLKPLHGKSLLVEITDWKLEILFLPVSNKIHLRINTDTTADATLRATLQQFIAFAKHAQAPGAFQQHKLQVSGDLGTLQAYQTLFQQLNLDWEVWLASMVGSTAAAGIGKSIKHLLNWQRQVCQSTAQDITEYLQEEKRILVGREELEDFYQDLAQFRQDLERFNANLNHRQQH
jgi:ubiquinone biosynthesis protein UbiJ